MRVFIQDLGFGMRTLWQQPAFTGVATLVLALGIGATTVIFSVIDAVMLRPMPYPDAGRLVVAWEANESRGMPIMNVAPPNLADWRNRSRSFEALGAWIDRPYTVQSTGGVEQLRGAALTHELFAALGVAPQIGRTFMPAEHYGPGARVVLVSHGYWRRAFGSDPAVLGQSLRVDGEPREVVGVMPEGFNFAPPVELEGIPAPRRNDLWTPLAETDLNPQRGAHYLLVLGRLRPGVDVAMADRELKQIAAQIGAEHPGTNRGWSARVVPLAEQVTGDQRPTLAALALAVAMVLLLACANVAALLLARGIGRRHEFAIRTALGATRPRLARQLLTESLLHAALGGAAGIVIASWAARAVRLMGGPLLPRLDEVTLDGRALAFVMLACAAATLLFGVLPALYASRTEVVESLRQRGTAPRAARLQSALVVMELALSVVLLWAAALLGTAFFRLVNTDPGFSADQALTAHVTLPEARYRARPDRVAFLDRVLDRLRRTPGIAWAGAIDAAPIADDRQGTGVDIEGDAPPAAVADANVNFAFVTPGYFQALGVPILRGRDFSEADRAESVPVIIVNQAFARLFFGERDPIGRRIRPGFNTQTAREIIAVVGDERHVSLGQSATPGIFVTFHQAGWATQLTLAVRTTGAPAAASSALREAVRAADPEVPVYDVRTMREIVSESVSRPRLAVVLLGTFAAAALLLSAVGVYGVMSQAVGQRMTEFGVRLALGAAPGDLSRLVLGFAVRLAALGMLAGVPAALFFGRVLAALLEGIVGATPAACGIVPLTLTLTVIAAALLPARRASRVDPIVALRAH